MNPHQLNLRSVFAPLLIGMAAMVSVESTAHAAGYICAEGGGGLSKGTWAKGVFEWMIEHGGERRVVVLGYHADPDLAVERVFREAGASSVNHVVAADRATSDSETTSTALLAADIIWIRGGDQSKYVKQWRGTRTEAAIRAVYDRGGVIGGTSAGAAILGEVIYDAFNGSLTSAEALSNAYHPVLTLTSDFLRLTPGVLFDTHFTERGRLGRLAVMMTRRFVDAQEDLIGIGLDYRTALCVSPDLTAEVRGEGTVTVMHRTNETLQVISRGRPAVVTNLAYDQLIEGYRYDLKSRTVIARPAGIQECNGAPSRRRFFACTLDGAYDHAALFGDWVLSGADSDKALFEGRISLEDGGKALSDALIVSNALMDDGMVENRFGGAAWALARHPGSMALLLTAGIVAESSPPAVISLTGKTQAGGSAIILDGRTMTHCGESQAGRRKSGRLRQAAAIEGIRLQLLSDGQFYDADSGVALLARRAADMTADGEVTRADLLAFAEFIAGARAASWQAQAADANQDGKLDASDVLPFTIKVLNN